MAMRLPYRRLAQAAEWSLLAIVVLLHVAGWVWYEPIAAAGPIGLLLADSLPLAGLLIVATWCALGPGYAWLRAGVAAALVLGSIAATSSTWQSRYSWTHSDTLLGLTPLATLVGAAALRLTGLRTQGAVAPNNQTRGATFTIFGLLATTTVLAAAIGFLEAARPWLRQYRSEDAIRLTASDLSALEPFQVGATVVASSSTPWNVVAA